MFLPSDPPPARSSANADGPKPSRVFHKKDHPKKAPRGLRGYHYVASGALATRMMSSHHPAAIGTHTWSFIDHNRPEKHS